MNKREILNEVSFGKRIAEEEIAELSSYFVETDQWKRIYYGEVDIVYGPKGSGKSAIYFLLINKQAELEKKGIITIAAENPRGTPVFKDIASDPPTTEIEFCNLWKLYLATLIGYYLRQNGNPDAKELVSVLEKAGLLTRERNLRGMLQSVVEYVRYRRSVESIEGGMQLDPTTGTPMGFTGKITLREPSSKLKGLGYISIDNLLESINTILSQSETSIWLLIDRLDVAFADSLELEQNALRALFKVYLDIINLERISLKVFLRSDIWNRITDSGFREASHITRGVTIQWDEPSLLNLVVRRILKNEVIKDYLNVTEEEVLSDYKKQEELFYRIFPDQVDPSDKQPSTFTWMLSRTADGSDYTAPRELIHLLSATREEQLRKLELGNTEPLRELLFEGSSIKKALLEVSKVRVEQTLYSEYPSVRPYLAKLDRRKTEQSVKSLAIIWGIGEDDALTIATELVNIGVFKKRSKHRGFTLWVPFLFRSGLNMIQGSE